MCNDIVCHLCKTTIIMITTRLATTTTTTITIVITVTMKIGRLIRRDAAGMVATRRRRNSIISFLSAYPSGCCCVVDTQLVSNTLSRGKQRVIVYCFCNRSWDLLCWDRFLT